MIREMDHWPQVLRDALAPGIAPILDQLAEATRQEFWREVSQEMPGLRGETVLMIQDLESAAVTVLEQTSEDVIFQALKELWHLNEYALPFPASFDAVFGSIIGGAMLSHDIMIDLLYAAMTTRARLDPAVEREELERQAMKKLSMREVDPAVQSVADALAGRVGDSVPYMTFDELVSYLTDSR